MSAQLVDWLERHCKAAAKGTYRRPVIEGSRIWRRLLSHTCFIGVTGSAGKTTTKDLLHAALAGRHTTASNSDSNNQLYGIARTLLGVSPRTRYCVQEIGAAAPGGFEPMLQLLQPRVGIVTNIGTDHRSAFRNREGVAAEKRKLVDSLPADGLAVLNIDDDLVAAMAATCRARVVTYGLHRDALFRAEILAQRWPDHLRLRIHAGADSVLVQTRMLGAQQAGNVLAAVATACSLGVPLSEAATAVAAHAPQLGRMSVHPTRRGVTFIRDDWKAPDWSLRMALDFMREARAPRRLIVLGTISDGGGRDNIYKRAVARALDGVDVVLLVGPRAAASGSKLQPAAPGRLCVFETVQAASQWLNEHTRDGDLVMLKGSNTADHLSRLALGMERSVGCWRARCARNIFCDRCRLLAHAAAP